MTVDPEELANAFVRELVADPGKLSPSRRRQPPPSEPPENIPVDLASAKKQTEALSTVLQMVTLRARSRARANAAALMDDGADRDDPEVRLRRLLVQAHTFLMEHPLAARAVFSGLAAEGRAYAKSENGAALREQLRQSSLVRRGALLWNSLTMGMLDDNEPTRLPSAYLDALVEAATTENLEELLGKVSE